MANLILDLHLPNWALPLLFVLLLLGLLWVTWRNPRAAETLRESLFRNAGVSYRNLIGLLFGIVAALLVLTSNTWTMPQTVWVFLGSLALILFLLIIVRPRVEKELDRFAWGLLVITNLGFGLGALVYQARTWWVWLWNKYRLIDQPHELVLEFLFLLGVILGVFVVRNWAKEQEAFTNSLSGLLGGTFIAGLFGEAFKGQGLTTMQALTYYGLGFVMSAAMNLLIAAFLTANYTNKRSIASRALLDFLYGSDRTKLIDGYFLKNFKDDPDYAKRGLTETLIECRKLVRREFADRLELRRGSRKKERRAFLARQDVKDAQANLAELQDESDRLVLGDEPVKEIEKEQRSQRLILKRLLKQTKPSFFYELIAIECEDAPEEADEEAPVAEKDRQYRIIYKHIGSSSPLSRKVEDKMFRVGVSARWQDKLEYVTAPGEYRVPFPYQNSVAGLALEFRQTIIMNRDIHKRFRNKQYANGICPKDIEQDRGLDEIDYLSYVSIPIVSRPGTPDENAVGVLTIDTKLFVSHSKLDGQSEKGSEGIFSVKLTKAKLSEYASNLYDHEDKDVKYIEDVTKIITPVLELYSKCRVGAI
jgi:hypothetical protein